MNRRSYATRGPADRPRANRPGSRRHAKRFTAFTLAFGALLALLLGTAGPADAHAALIRTDPAEGSVVETAPQRVVLTFSEGVLLSDDSLRVYDPRGTNVAVGTPGHADGGDSRATATVALRPGIGNGTYTVAWRAISQDSHPVAGAFTFSVGAPSRTTVDLSGIAAVGGGAAAFLYGIGRYVSYLGFALLVGGSVFLSVCWPRGALLGTMRRLVAGGWVAMVAGAIGLIALRGPYVNGKGLGQVFDTGVMRAQLETRPGAALLSRLLLLAAAAVFLAVLFGSYAKREDPAERADLAWGLAIGGTVVAVGIAATWAMAEHASVGIQRKLAMPVDVVHLLSMAVWLGGLITLLTALWAPSAAGTVERWAVRRFSLIALTAITLLVGTGTYQAWRQIGTWRAFTDTSYGRLLLIKIGLVCSLVAVAWFSRRWTGRLGAAKAAAVAGAAKEQGAKEQGAKASARVSARAAATGTRAKGAVEQSVEQSVKTPAGTGPKTGVKTGATTGAKASATVSAGADAGAAEVTAGRADAAAVRHTAGSAVPSQADKAGEERGDGAGDRAAHKDGDKSRAREDATDGGTGTTVPAAASTQTASGPTASGPAASVPAAAPHRAAQLRRQQAARESARARKARNADPARAALRRSVLAEAAVAVVLLAVTTMLTGSQPGRAAEEQKGLAPAPAAPAAGTPGTTSSPGLSLTVPYDTGGPNGKGVAAVSMSPVEAGLPGVVHVILTDPAGKPVEVPEVRLSFTLAAKSLGPIQVPLKRFAAGHWIASGVRLPLAGSWQMSLTVRTSDIDEVTRTRNVEVAG